MSKQGTWWIWDSRGGINNEPTHIQLVNFDLEHNIEQWRKISGTKITGSIKSGRVTYKNASYGPRGLTIEFWRDDQPNPTPYTIVDNPDSANDSGWKAFHIAPK